MISVVCDLYLNITVIFKKMIICTMKVCVIATKYCVHESTTV